MCVRHGGGTFAREEVGRESSGVPRGVKRLEDPKRVRDAAWVGKSRSLGTGAAMKVAPRIAGMSKKRAHTGGGEGGVADTARMPTVHEKRGGARAKMRARPWRRWAI